MKKKTSKKTKQTGKTAISMNAKLLKRAQARAAADHRSFSNYVATLVHEDLKDLTVAQT